MNERIIDLANEANDAVGFQFELTEAKKLHELMEKFAELIVRECGNYLMSDEFIGRSDLDWDIVLNEHFGVK
jgi:hypothetical protein